MATTKMELEVNESTGKFYIQKNKGNINSNGSINQNNNSSSSKIRCSNSIEQTTVNREHISVNRLVGSIKSFVSNIFIKPIIDMTSMIVGTDMGQDNHHHHHQQEPATSLPMSLKSILWNETTANDCGGVVVNGAVGNGVVVTANTTTTNGNSPTKNSPPTIYLDNKHSSDTLIFSSCEKSVVLMNFFHQPDTFFDCDDYIEGGEDTIDFVADSTKIEYNTFGDDIFSPTKLLNDSPKNSNSALSTFDKTPPKPINDVNIKTIEQPIPSPEEIPYGCIFTKFFRLNNSTERSPLLQMCYKEHKARQLHETNELLSKERPSMSSSLSSLSSSPCRRTSENESDDSFIVFEDSSPQSTDCVEDLHITRSTTLKNYYNRQRQLSECSDDFIFFEGDSEDDTTDEDFTDSTDDSDSEDESDIESDCSDFPVLVKRKHDVENKDQPDSGFEENKDQDSGPEERKVTFNLCPTVHVIRAWNYAYSEARKGKWEQMGRDRERFEKRINALSHTLSPILKADHRQKIYNERFNDDQFDHNTKHISNKREKFFNCKKAIHKKRCK